VLRVGVTGHRPDDLAHADAVALRARIREVLERLGAEAITVAEADAGVEFGADPPELRLISPLAEGADRIVAQEALDAGYSVHAPLPFPREVLRRELAWTARVALHGGRDVAGDAALIEGGGTVSGDRLES